MRLLNITDELISKTKDHVYNTILLWRELNLSVTPSSHWFEVRIVYQIENIVGWLADKSEYHIERCHQYDKRSEKTYCGLTNF